MLSSMSRLFISRLLGSSVQDDFEILAVTIESTRILITVRNITVTATGCISLASALCPNKITIQSVVAQTLEISCDCVYFIPYRISISVLGIVAHILPSDVLTTSNLEDVLPQTSSMDTDASSALGLMSSWLRSCVDNVSVVLRDSTIHIQDSATQGSSTSTSGPYIVLKCHIMKLTPQFANATVVCKVGRI
jgi:hypothetical protein